MRQDVYGVAFAEANAELGAISGRFEQLRARKEHLEGVIRAIGCILEVETQAAPMVATETRTAVVAAAMPPAPAGADPIDYTFNQVPVPLPDLSETGGDPFQRRVRNALKMQGLGNSPQNLQPAV